jgi:hypothetical protein
MRLLSFAQKETGAQTPVPMRVSRFLRYFKSSCCPGARIIFAAGLNTNDFVAGGVTRLLCRLLTCLPCGGDILHVLVKLSRFATREVFAIGAALSLGARDGSA